MPLADPAAAVTSESLIRGRYLLQKSEPPETTHLVDDAAVFQRDGVIVEVGPYAELRARHPETRELGSRHHLVMPGLVNAHHHGGLSNRLLGCADGPLELWLSEMWARRDVDPYLDTLWGCLHFLRSGVTTVMHNYVRWVPPAADTLAASAGGILRAYAEAGLRVAFSVAMRDQRRIVYTDDEVFLASLPSALAWRLASRLGPAGLSRPDYFALFEHLLARHGQNRTACVRILLSPSNLQWSSDEFLADIKRYAATYRTGIHTHLDETRYQHDWALRTLGKTPAAHLHGLGLLGPELSCAHGVWLTDGDLDLFADSGATICHNASSNLRLRSGTARLDAMLRRDIPVALGIDSNGLNDDHDMLQEIRLVSLLHRGVGHERSGPTPAHLLQMATANGAAACGFEDVGTLQIGKRADAVLIDLERLAGPCGIPDRASLVDLLLHRATPAHVDAVLVDGEPVFLDGRPTRFDADALTSELRARLAQPLTPAEQERREIARALRPFIRSFYSNWR
ncbi:MAG: amidohydrolase [Candidatus Rokuibacteriota bacterium]|nr:MAG: amidohydrolase [Candidatus Rokubacteria bacterium]